MMAKDFAELDAMDQAHLASIGRPNGYILPELNGRAADLKAMLRPLAEIKPALRSRYLVKNWIDRGALSVVYGESNAGKTFFALDLAFHIAGGAEDWHGNRITEAVGPVVYIAAEGGHGVRNRLAALKREKPELAARAAEAFLLLPGTVDLCGNADAEALVKALADLPEKPSLIVVDTLARAMGDGDENTAKDMGAFVRNLDLLRTETGAHVSVIHHSGKDTSKGARGSNSLRAAADTEIELTRSGAVVMAETKKQRDMPTDQVFAYALRGVFLGKDEDGDDVTSAVLQPTDPVKKWPRLSGQQAIAMQALDDALAKDGEKKHGDMFPANRRVVTLKAWRDMCDRHALTEGKSDSAARQAFGRVWKALQEKGLVRVIDGFAWRCADTDATVTTVTGRDTSQAVTRACDRDKRDTPLKGGHECHAAPATEQGNEVKAAACAASPEPAHPFSSEEGNAGTQRADLSERIAAAFQSLEAMDENDLEAWG